MTWGSGTDSAWRPPGPGGADGSGGPESVDGYGELVEVGRGGDSIVYRARDTSMRRDVAVKVLLVDDDDRAARFAREVEITIDLGRQHPNIVTVLAVATTRSGRPAIVMDFHEGGTLHDRLRSHGPMPVEEVVRVGEVVADALAFAHGRGVLHRDVKPQNVLVLPTSWVLADFGIARLADAEHTSSAETFTYRHAAPQVLDGYAPTAADDVWSLGSTLFTLLDGRPPFASDDPHDDSALSYLRRARTEPHRRLGVPGSERLAQVVDRCLEKRVEDRWPSAAALRDALTSLRGSAWEPAGAGEPATPVTPAVPVPPVAPTPTPAGPDDEWVWQPAPASVPAPVPTDRTAPRHRLPPVPPPAPIEERAEPAPVALSVAGRTPEPVDAEATGVGPALEAPIGPSLPEEPAAGSPTARGRRSLVLVAAVLVVGSILGIGGAALRDRGEADPVAEVTPSTGAAAIPTLGAEPSDAVPVRDLPEPELAPVITDLRTAPEGLRIGWRPLDNPDVAFYSLVRILPDEKPVAELPAASSLEVLAISVPTGRSCYNLWAFLVDGRFGISERRCVVR